LCFIKIIGCILCTLHWAFDYVGNRVLTESEFIEKSVYVSLRPLYNCDKQITVNLGSCGTFNNQNACDQKCVELCI
jgi:hypothetical protein